MLPDTGQGASHEIDPDRQCGVGSELAVAEGAVIREAHPNRCGERPLIAREPRVGGVGGSRFSAEIVAFEAEGSPTRSLANDVPQNIVHLVGHPSVHDRGRAERFRACRAGRGADLQRGSFEERFSALERNPLD